MDIFISPPPIGSCRPLTVDELVGMLSAAQARQKQAEEEIKRIEEAIQKRRSEYPMVEQ